MIQSVMLVMLGFFLSGLIASLLAPSLYKRAARLAAKRIESTMPLTLSEIEADKDQIRAGYAVKVRRLESALGRSKDKNAGQRVEISRLHMAIAAIQDHAAGQERQLEERRNAATVFEQTIRKRFPELEAALSQAKTALEEQSLEINDLRNKLQRRNEALEASERSLQIAQAEVKQLRDAMERGGSEQSGRFAKRPSQWALEEYRAEYDRLNVELSKLREELALAQDRESQQTAVLKVELQQLAQQIMTTAAAQAELARWRPAAPAGGSRSTERAREARLAEQKPGAAPGQHRAPTWPRGYEARPKGQERPAELGPAMVETSTPPAEGARRPITPATPPDKPESEGADGEKPGEAGIRSLLDRLRDMPEPLAGA
jgi:hypothetical protein